MADIRDDSVNQTIPEEQEHPQAPPKKSFLKFGLPMLIVQIVVAYFLASYVIVPMFIDKAKAETAAKAEKQDDEDSNEKEDDFGFIYMVEDVIVNPAESQGEQFVLVNIAFELKEEDDVKRMEKREPKIRDMLIKIISSKTITQLDGADDKEALRLEIKKNAEKLVPANHLNNVYFVNYIIQ